MQMKLAHICIESNDLEATEAFYACLGIKRQFEFRNKQNERIGMYLSFSNQTYIEVVKVRDVRSEGTIQHFAIEVEDVDAVYGLLLEKNIDVSEKRLGGDNTWMVTCRDPNGIFIEFHEYTKESMQQVGGTCIIDYQP